jgi:hypothetical protein
MAHCVGEARREPSLLVRSAVRKARRSRRSVCGWDARDIAQPERADRRPQPRVANITGVIGTTPRARQFCRPRVSAGRDLGLHGSSGAGSFSLPVEWLAVTRDRLKRCRRKYATEEHLQESDRREGNNQPCEHSSDYRSSAHRTRDADHSATSR